MGWDAYATTHVDDFDTCEELLEPKFKRAFEEADKELCRLIGRPSGYLKDGQLGGTSFHFLEKGTSKSCYDPNSEDGKMVWSSEEVKLAWEGSDWDISHWQSAMSTGPTDPLDRELGEWDRGEAEEARLFLRTAAEHGLAVVFTY